MSNDTGIFSLKGKVVVVTGGTRKYGRCFCEALAGVGATVVVTSRDKKRAQETAASFTEKGQESFGYALDLAQDDSIASIKSKGGQRRVFTFGSDLEQAFVAYGNMALVVLVPLLIGVALYLRRRALQKQTYTTRPMV